MMYTSFIAPTEKPITSLEVKRALLTFDKVYLPDPDDRDLFPPQAFLQAAHGHPPIIGLPTGSVRTLGKFPNYNNDFDKLLEELKYARRIGLIDVVSSYDVSTSQKITLGNVTCGYPLDPRFMLFAYRSLARNNDALITSIKNDSDLLKLPEEQVYEIIELNARADGSINNDPALPLIEADLNRDNLRTEYTNIARSRLGSVMKSIGYCTAKNIVPVFSNPNYNSIVNLISDNANKVIDSIGKEDPYWSSRNQVLRLAHEEYIDESVLAKMSLDDVIKLRTSAWGKQAEARDSLLKSAAELAREYKENPDFEKKILEKIKDYKRDCEKIKEQRAMLNLNIRCDILPKVGFVALGELTANNLSHVQSAIGAGTVLIAGCLYAYSKIKDYKPIIDNIKRAEEEFKDNLCFGVHNYYNKAKQVMAA